MNPLQTMLGLSVAGAAGGYLLVRLLLASRVEQPKKSPPAAPDPLAKDLAAALPARSETKSELQKMLWTAGYYRPSALNEYLALRAILVLGLLIGTGLVALLVEPAQIPITVIIGVVLAGLGFSLPRLILGAQASARARRLVRGLPTAMDVIGLCLTAGQNLLGSIEQTSKELAQPFPDLSDELQIVHQQASMHSLEQALTQWANRLDVPEIRSLALLLVQSERLGTDMVDTLLEVADSQRIHLRQKAEAQANRSNFWMLFPTLFCLWIAAAIILVGPVYLEFWRYRREQMNTLIQGARTQVERTGMTGATNQAGTPPGSETSTSPVAPSAPSLLSPSAAPKQ